MMVDAVVTGRGLAALAAALDIAELGLSVMVTAGADPLGSAPRPGSRDFDPERDPSGAISALADALAQPLPGDHPAATTSEHAMAELRRDDFRAPLLQSRTGVWCEQNEPNVWGIPSVPLSEATSELIGSGASFRAYLDRVMPILTIGKTQQMGKLVRGRIGRTAHDRLVEPQLRERFGVGSDSIDVSIAAHGLNEAMTRVGSLTGAALAYSERYMQDESRLVPTAGWAGFVDALIARLRLYGVEFSDAEITEIAPSIEDADDWQVQLGDGREMTAHAVIVDTDDSASLAATAPLIESVLPEFARVHARTSGSPRGGERDTLQRSGEWTIRTAPNGSIQLLGPRARARRDRGSAQLDAPGAEEQQQITAFLRAAGIEVDHPIEADRRPAPYISLAEREAAQLRFEHLATEHRDLLPVGRTIHGDELSQAIQVARRGAVTLRRRLLGLIEQ